MATLVEQLAALLVQNGIDLQEVAQAAARITPPKHPAPRCQQPRAGYASTVMAAPVAAPPAVSPAAPAVRVAPRPQGGKYAYGKAPTLAGPQNLPDPVATQKAREAALEAALPGITKIAYVYPVGLNAQRGQPGESKLTKDVRQMENSPWTWIELPAGRNQTVGALTPDMVRQRLAACGYGFSPSNGLWATDCKGCPVHRMRHYRPTQAGRQMLNVDETDQQ